jgi:hypothetical protein
MHRRVGQIQLRGLAWVAIVATLMLALAPAISSVLRGANYAAWVNVCRTTSVAASTPASPNSPDSPGGTGHLSTHCPYCALHTDALPPAPGTPHVPRDVQPTFMEPQAFLQAPSVGHVWRHAPSRAPPWLS